MDQEKDFFDSLGSETEAPEIEIKPEKKSTENIKKLKFKAGEEEFEIPLTAQASLETKDGQKLDITLEDLSRSPWAQSDISKRYSELDKQRKELEKWGDFRDRLRGSKDLRGYDRVAHIIQELTELNPELREDIKEFETQYTQKIADYLQADEVEREAVAERYHRESVEKENQRLKKNQSQDFQEYTYNRASKLVNDYSMFGLTLPALDNLANRLISEGRVDPVTDKRSLDRVLNTVEELVKTEFEPKKEQATKGLSQALAIVEKISPELAKSDEAVLDAYKLLVEKGLPQEKVIKKLRALYEDTLQDDVKEVERQKERVTGKKESGQRTTKKSAVDDDFLIMDPEDAFRKGLY